MEASQQGGIPFPDELRPVRAIAESYVTARIKQFSGAFSRRLNVPFADPAQLDAAVQATLADLAQQEMAANASTSSRGLRLVLRHDCQSTGCGEIGCLICQYNPSRLCKQNLKSKYLIDDHLKAKCGASLRVELVDENGACVSEGLPHGAQLEVSVLNGEKYKEVCPDNTLLSHLHLRTCVISHHQRALLKKEGGSDDQLRCFLQLEGGQGALSDLSVTTSSEALLAGKAPTFRLLICAVDAMGEPVTNVTYVVSENFVVATKRVKHAIKSDIPSVADPVAKLVHIGKATVDKLLDLRGAARDEGLGEILVPDDLNRVEKVGQFQQLIEQCDMYPDLKSKVRHLLKLSPEKWDEVCNHAQAAVVPDFRNRVWWSASGLGLLFACKNGSTGMEHPIALVKMAPSPDQEDQVIPIHQLDPNMFQTIPRLKQQALANWYAGGHPGWAIYWKQDQGGMDVMGGGGGDTAAAMLASAQAAAQAAPVQGGGGPFAQHLLPPVAALDAGGGGGGAPTPRPHVPSPFESIAKPPSAPSSAPASGQNGGRPGASTSASPFAIPGVMNNISDAFPPWQQNAPPPGGGAAPSQAAAATGNLLQDNSLGSLGFLNSGPVNGGGIAGAKNAGHGGGAGNDGSANGGGGGGPGITPSLDLLSGLKTDNLPPNPLEGNPSLTWNLASLATNALAGGAGGVGGPGVNNHSSEWFTSAGLASLFQVASNGGAAIAAVAAAAGAPAGSAGGAGDAGGAPPPAAAAAPPPPPPPPPPVPAAAADAGKKDDPPAPAALQASAASFDGMLTGSL